MAAAPENGSFELLVAEDSTINRLLLRRLLRRLPGARLSMVADGDAAVEAATKTVPDVALIDLDMPGVDGITTIRRLRRINPRLIPIAMCVGEEPDQRRRARSAGAIAILAKPGAADADTFAGRIGDILQSAASHLGTLSTQPPPDPAPASRPRDQRLIVLAGSTGAPRVLEMLLPAIGPSRGCRTLVAQHFPKGFGGSLAQSLRRSSKVGLEDAVSGTELEAGRAYIAQPGVDTRVHLARRGALLVRIDSRPRPGISRPSIDALLSALDPVIARRTHVFILSGMGRDGCDGVAWIKKHGGACVAQSEDTCSVYGMPRAVFEAGLADEVLAPRQMCRRLSALTASGVERVRG